MSAIVLHSSSSVTRFPVSYTRLIEKPVHKKKRVTQVALDYLGTTKGVKNLLIRPLNLSLRTVSLWQSGLSEGGRNVQTMADHANQILEIGALPSTFSSFLNDFGAFRESVKKKSSKEIVRASAKAGLSGAGLGLTATSLIQAGCRASIYSLSPRSVTALKAAGAIGKLAVISGMVWDIAKEAIKISNGRSAVPRESISLSVVKIVEKAAIISLLGLSAASFFFGLSVASWIFLVLSAVGLIISIGTYFYEQMRKNQEESSRASIDL